MKKESLKQVKAERDFYKGLLTNVYMASDYLGQQARFAANDLLAPSWGRNKSCGNADSYDAIKQMIIMYDSIGNTNYYKVHNIIKELPNILK